MQPLLATASGAVHSSWALRLSVPALTGAVVIFGAGRLWDRGDVLQPPWYAAWLLFPGSFVLAGAAAMCIFGALVEFPTIPVMMWTLLAAGTVLWSGGILLVRRASR